MTDNGERFLVALPTNKKDSVVVLLLQTANTK